MMMFFFFLLLLDNLDVDSVEAVPMSLNVPYPFRLSVGEIKRNSIIIITDYTTLFLALLEYVHHLIRISSIVHFK